MELFDKIKKGLFLLSLCFICLGNVTAQNVAKIGTMEYATLEEAVTAASDGNVIEVIGNIEPESVQNITINKSLTITASTANTFTLKDYHFTLSGNTVEVTVSNLNFSGDSYINAANGKGLTVNRVNATVNPQKITGRSAFIVLSTSEATTGLDFTLTNSTIVNTCGTDGFGAAIFGWAYLHSATITNNVLGSDAYRYRFIAVKLMNVTNEAEHTIANNIVYGTNASWDFFAFDLYQNNSRANSYTVLSNSNILDITVSTGNNVVYAFDIERNGNANAQIVVLDNGTTINGTPITTNDFKNDIPVAQFNGYYAVGVEVSSTGKYMSGTYSTNVSGGQCADGYASFANGTDPETYTIAEAYAITYDANLTPQKDTILYVKKSVAEHTALPASTFTNGDLALACWNTKADGTGSNIFTGVTMTLDKDTVLYAVWARVFNATQGTFHDDLSSAVTAANANDSIVLLANLALASSQTIAKNIKINLNEHTISGSTEKLINITAGDVTIKNGNISSTQKFAIEQAGTGTLTLTDFEVSGNIRVVHVGTGGTVNANNSVITSTGNATVQNEGNFNASNCTIRTSGTGAAVMNSSSGVINLNNCTVSTEGSTAINNTGSLVNINGGTVTSKCGSGFTINTSRGTVNIYGDVVITTCCRAIQANVGSPAYTDANPPAVVVNFGGYEEGGHLVASGHPRIVVRDDDTPTGADLSVVRVYYKNGVVNIFGDASIKATNTNVQSAISVWNGGSVEITGGSIEANSTVVRAGKWVGDGTGFPVVTNNIEISDSAQLVSSTDGTTIVVLNEDVYPSEVEIWGGVFTDDVSGDKCRDGYAAFPNGTVPETYTVASSYTIYYNANNGTTEQDTVYVRQTEPAHTVVGNSFANGSFIFNGWNTKADGTGDTYAPDATMTLTQDTTLYAQWRGVAKIGDTHYTTLNAAAAAVPVGTPTTITILQNLNFYDIASSNLANKTITFTGTLADTLTVTDLLVNTHKQHSAGGGSNLTFENITLKHDPTADNYQAITDVSKITCNDCEILGYTTGYAETVICNNCTFTQTTGKYHLWTYASNCTFNSCTFNTSYNDGKAVNVYIEDHNAISPYRVVTFNDCSFNAPSNPGINRSAIQINSYGQCYVVYVNNCDVTGYHNEAATAVDGYKDLVNNKEGSAKTTLYINGVQLLKQSDCDPVAKIDEVYYTTLQDALDAAYGMTGDVTVNLIRNTAEDVTISQKVGLNYTIDGNNDTLQGRIFVDGKRLYPSNDPGEVIITNMNFTFNDALSYGDATKGFVCNSTNNLSYAAHVTVSNCTFDGGIDGVSNGMAAYRDPAGAQSWDITLDHLVAKNCHSLVQATSVSGIKVTHCKAVDNVKNGINISGGGSAHIPGVTDVFTISEDTLTCNASGEYSLRIQQISFPGSFELSDNFFTAPKAIITKANQTSGSQTCVLNVTSGYYNGIISVESLTLNNPARTINDTTNYNFTGGTFKMESSVVDTMCAEGYMAIDEDPTVGFCTVHKMYWVTYDANGGTGTPMTPSYVAPTPGTTFEVKDNEGYTYGAANFTGWNTKADGTGIPYAAGATMAIESDTTLYAQWGYVAMIGTTPYATLQAAVDSANKNMTGDVTIDLIQNTTEYVEVLQKNTNNLIINGNNDTIFGQMLISAKGENWDGTDYITVTNLNFVYDPDYFNGDASDPNNEMGLLTFCKNCGSDRIRSTVNYAHNVTISNCNFDADGSDQGVYAIASVAGSVNHLVIDNCTAKNAKALASLQSDPQFVLTNCSTEDVTYGVRVVNNDGPLTMTHNNFSADEVGILFQYCTTGAELIMVEDTVNAPVAFQFDNTVNYTYYESSVEHHDPSKPGINLNIPNGLYIGDVVDNSVHNADTSVLHLTGGTYSVDLTGEPCAPGYAAFANGTTPETWTVAQAWFLYYDKNETEAEGTMDTLFVRRDGTAAERTLVVAPCEFTWLPSHSFKEWNTKADGNGTPVAVGNNIELTSDTTLYVIWQEGNTIFYHNNGGTGTIANQYKAIDQTITLSDGTGFSKTDSTLYRWNTTADEAAGSTNYALGAEYSDNANLDLYAVWRKNLNMTMNSTDVVCYGENNGTDTVKIIGGDPTYMIVLSSTVLAQNDTVRTSETQYVFTNLKPGAYTVTLTDTLNKDVITGTFTIAQPDTLVISSLTVPDAPCPLMGTGEYAVSMTTTGGNGGNVITWGGDVTDADALSSSITPDADDRDRTYTVTVTVTDSKNCSATQTATFSVSPVIANDETTHSNTTMTVAPISQSILYGCDTVIRNFGTPEFVFTNPAITEDILDTVYNNVATAFPDSIFTVGENTIIWTAVDTCGHTVTAEQTITITHKPCPTVTDYDENSYPAVRIGCDCWTTKNLVSTHYSYPDDHSEIPDVRTYPINTRASVYGNLYTYEAAMHGETVTGTTPVQGACPEGWHVPSQAEAEALMSSSEVRDLMSQGTWIPDNGTNASGFNILPGGFYNAELDRYERMYVSAYFWIAVPATAVYHACEFGAACSSLELIPGSLENGFSIRCVLTKPTE